MTVLQRGSRKSVQWVSTRWCALRERFTDLLAPGVSLGAVCISLSHDALIQSWSRMSSPARNFSFMCRGVAGEITMDSVKCLAAFPGLLEAATPSGWKGAESDTTCWSRTYAYLQGFPPPFLRAAVLRPDLFQETVHISCQAQ